MRRMIVACSVAMLLLTLTACNTMDGAGKDIEEAGEAIQDGAD